MNAARPRILVIDNYDSFTYNLVHALAQQGADVEVRRNDTIDRAAVAALAPDGIVLSPGPGHPAVQRDFGVCADLIREPLDMPMLGVCLGMQGMAQHTGGTVVRAPELVHGEASPASLEEHPLFAGLPRQVPVGRYHSLAVQESGLPSEWRVIARTGDLVMGIAHRSLPWTGVQFHPESILTPDGPSMVRNFVESCQ